MLNDNMVDKWKEKGNWKSYTHFEITINHLEGTMYWKEKGDVLINLDTISAIKKVVGKGVDGNDYFVLTDY